MDEATNIQGPAAGTDIPPTIEEYCGLARRDIENIKGRLCGIQSMPFPKEDVMLSGGNMPPMRNGNMRANLTIAFRSLEDARMRLGKVMQAYQGGISILDK